MARSELAERIQPALHGLGEAAGTAASDMAEAWREHGAPAASAVMETVREKARERAIPAAAALRDRAVPAAENVRDRALPAAASLREKLGPATESVKGALAPAAASALEKVAPAAEAARDTSKRAAKKAAKRAKSQRKEATKRAKSVKAAAKGEKKRRWPFLVGALAVGAGVAAAVNATRKKNEPAASSGYGENLNGAYSSEPSQTTEEPAEH
ncbi:MAG TPA: hypothetical protein VHC49_24560 [Mycobacteriales bacterium]|nr:hypothetical protein [Mycobacteriales bacterium]